MKLRTAFLTVSAFALAAACTPASEAPAAPPPAAPPIAEAETPAATPAAENTSDSLASAPATAAPATATPAGPAPAAPPAPASAAGPTAEELANGRAVYASTCAMCHGPAGQGTQMGVALTAGLDYASIKEKVVKGMINPGDKMPPMGAALSADQLDDVSKFVEAGLPQ